MTGFVEDYPGLHILRYFWIEVKLPTVQSRMDTKTIARNADAGRNVKSKRLKSPGPEKRTLIQSKRR